MKGDRINSSVFIQMKFLIYFCVIGLCTTNFANAAEKSKKPATKPAATETTETKPSESKSNGLTLDVNRVGLGFATFNNIGGTSTAISAWTDISSDLSAQILLAIGGTSPFEFGIGGFARKTLFGGLMNGFHVGGGFHLGTLNLGGSAKFYVSMVPIFGFHFTWPGTNNIGLSFDGGPNFSIIDGNFNFSTSALSPLFGLNIHYFF